MTWLLCLFIFVTIKFIPWHYILVVPFNSTTWGRFWPSRMILDRISPPGKIISACKDYRIPRRIMRLNNHEITYSPPAKSSQIKESSPLFLLFENLTSTKKHHPSPLSLSSRWLLRRWYRRNYGWLNERDEVYIRGALRLLRYALRYGIYTSSLRDHSTYTDEIFLGLSSLVTASKPAPVKVHVSTFSFPSYQFRSVTYIISYSILDPRPFKIKK